MWDKTMRKPVAKYGFAPPVLGLSLSFDEMMGEPESHGGSRLGAWMGSLR
jgi:hypothetical protein